MASKEHTNAIQRRLEQLEQKMTKKTKKNPATHTHAKAKRTIKKTPKKKTKSTTKKKATIKTAAPVIRSLEARVKRLEKKLTNK